MSPELGKFIPWVPALATVVCGGCCTRRAWRPLAGPACVLGTLASLLLTLAIFAPVTGADGPVIVTAFKWIQAGDFAAHFSYYLDSLTMLMLLVVCGIGTLIALYATGYMKGDPGYARFFFGVSLFIFAMTTLVMADNLVLMYLGWEGVGFCSYLLIGYYYKQPEAVAAAKKAFIVNRIGDLGFALGIFLLYTSYGTVSFTGILDQASQRVADAGYAATWVDLLVPFLLMLGAFGKSAQLPLYVWLPDAMAGPTPVSALVHAATMVTAGVYLIARLIPVFELSPYALPTVAVIGAATALMAGTIALCQYDLKKIYAYSTVSQLGYMFLGVGALSTFGGLFHLMTHAFFKALLFLTAGSVMHAMAGQLDLRKMSGLRHKMPVTCWLMFVGCLALAGFPFTAGFYSKDTILADAMAVGLNGDALYLTLAVLGLVTAFLTAFYTFRLWFRVFMGPEHYEMGDEHHGDEDDHSHDAHDDHAGHTHAPHEMPWWPMNAPLVVLAAGALAAGLVFYSPVKHWVHDSTANPHGAPIEVHAAGGYDAAAAGGGALLLVADPAPGEAADDAAHGGAHGHHPHHATLFGGDVHFVMQLISGAIAILGIALAAYFHWLHRPAADAVARAAAPVVTLLANKYYVDELYDLAIVRPLRGLGYVLFVVDQLVIDGVVMLVGLTPGLVGRVVRPTQSGRLQGYGLGMAAGLGGILLLVFWAITG